MKTREIRYRKSRRENFLEVPPRSGSSSQDLLIREWKKIESYSERVRGLDLFTKFPGGSGVRYVPAMWVTRVWSLGPKDPLEKGMVTHSSILGWRIQWTEKPWGQKESDMTERLTVSPSGTILVMTSSRCWYWTVSEWGWMGRTLQMTRLRNWRPWWRTGHPWGCGSLGMMAGLRARRTTVSQVLSHCDQEVYKWQQHGGRKLGITIWLKQVKLLSRVWLFATPWTVAHQAPPTMEFSRQEYWSGLPFPSPWGSSWPRDWTWVSHIVGRCFTLWATREDVPT